MFDTPAILGLSILILCTTVVFLLTYAALKQDPSKNHCFQTRRMFFAAAVLTGLGAIFMDGLIFYFYSSGTEQIQRGKEIFDACKTIIPPLVALVIGYYFGKSDSTDINKTGD